jgi:ligand-binding SRPBCC domain-containing protein
VAPAELEAPRGPDHEGMIFMADTTIARKLRALEKRHRHEFMPEEERLELRDRILKLKKRAAIEAGRS